MLPGCCNLRCRQRCCVWRISMPMRRGYADKVFAIFSPEVMTNTLSAYPRIGMEKSATDNIAKGHRKLQHPGSISRKLLFSNVSNAAIIPLRHSPVRERVRRLLHNRHQWQKPPLTISSNVKLSFSFIQVKNRFYFLTMTQ